MVSQTGLLTAYLEETVEENIDDNARAKSGMTLAKSVWQGMWESQQEYAAKHKKGTTTSIPVTSNAGPVSTAGMAVAAPKEGFPSLFVMARSIGFPRKARSLKYPPSPINLALDVRGTGPRPDTGSSSVHTGPEDTWRNPSHKWWAMRELRRQLSKKVAGVPEARPVLSLGSNGDRCGGICLGSDSKREICRVWFQPVDLCPRILAPIHHHQLYLPHAGSRGVRGVGGRLPHPLGVGGKVPKLDAPSNLGHAHGGGPRLV